MITQKRLKELLKYDKKTGIFIWKDSRRGAVKVGSIAGTEAENGYIVIKIDRKDYKAHRLAWLYEYGKMPTGQIDHKNRIKRDNFIDNLKDVTQCKNMKNKEKYKNNTSGETGVYWNEQIKKWLVKITINKKEIYLGAFETKEEATKVKKEAQIKDGYSKTHGENSMEIEVCTQCGREVEVEKKQEDGEFVCLYCGNVVLDLEDTEYNYTDYPTYCIENC